MGGLKHFIYKNTLDNHPKFHLLTYMPLRFLIRQIGIISNFTFRYIECQSFIIITLETDITINDRTTDRTAPQIPHNGISKKLKTIEDKPP